MFIENKDVFCWIISKRIKKQRELYVINKKSTFDI